jgi:hypothetical protein
VLLLLLLLSKHHARTSCQACSHTYYAKAVVTTAAATLQKSTNSLEELHLFLIFADAPACTSLESFQQNLLPAMHYLHSPC